MSVSDIPFNWDARLDLKKLRVGYIKESFDELTNAEAKANAMAMLDTLRSIGVTNFIEMKIPESQTNVSSLGVESFVYFDEMRREGKLTGRAWATPIARPRGCCRRLSTCSSSGCA
jgi:hypothetical protein